jgi:predicted Fe-S protein YdhL (DUF1289 family)
MTRSDSPCIAICDTLYQPTHCSGCGRTIGEVANWVGMTEDEKDAAWLRIETQGTAKRFTTYKERAQ